MVNFYGWHQEYWCDETECLVHDGNGAEGEDDMSRTDPLCFMLDRDTNVIAPEVNIILQEEHRDHVECMLRRQWDYSNDCFRSEYEEVKN